MTEENQANVLPVWEKPVFEVISVSMECTAYATTLDARDQVEGDLC